MNLRNCTMLLFAIFSLCCLTGVSGNRPFIHPSTSIEVADPFMDCELPIFAPLKNSELAEMERHEVEQKLARKLSFQERYTLRLLKRHIKRMDGLNPGQEACSQLIKKASNSLLFGIVGFFFAGIIFGILAISAGSKAVTLADTNPDCIDSVKLRNKGTAGIILGVIDIIGGFIVILLLL